MTRPFAFKSRRLPYGTIPPQRKRAIVLMASALCAGLCLALPPTAAAASESSTARSAFDFSIPPGSLSGALLQFSEISGKRVLFNADLVRGLDSSGLYGRYSTQQALRQLLAGSGLMPRETGSGSVTLERAPKEPAPRHRALRRWER